jgi:serine/threonine-protein kinase HipA
VLALRLAGRAGVDAATGRVAEVDGTPVAVIARFDRTAADERIPYVSAASMLQASRQGDHSYDDIVEAILRHSPTPIEDARQLWRRLVFGLLITNVDDHLQNHGFLYAGARQWTLAPAFDLNPMPGKLRESKTFLTAAVGPIDSVRVLLDAAAIFRLTPAQALDILAEVLDAVEGWKALAASVEVGLKKADIDHLAPAFEHETTAEARRMLGRPARNG